MITVYPYENKENCLFIDLNYMNTRKEEVPKVKRLSQIEKFNNKYNL